MSYDITKSRVLQWIGIILIIGVFAGAYWYFQVYGSAVNSPQNDSLTNGLVGLWSFNGDDISGTTAYDRSGSGNNGTLTNGPTVTQGKVGQALRFDGTDDYVTAGDIAAIDTATALSYCAWVRHQTITSDDAIISKEEVSVNAGGLLLYRDDVGSISARTDVYSLVVFDSADGDGVRIETPSNSTPSQTWTHVCGTYLANSANGLNLYVNGVATADNPVSTVGISAIDGLTNPLAIGTRSDTSMPYDGSIDEPRVYNRVLSATEIQSLYALGQSDKVNSSVSQPQGTGRLDSGLAGYWPLDENTGTSAGDSSTNGNTGTLTNGPTWTTGQIGSATTFDGTDDYVTMGNASALGFDRTTPFSFSFWLSPGSIASQIILSKEDSAAPYAGYFIAVSTTGQLRLALRNTITTNEIDTSTTDVVFTVGTWKHVVVTYSGSSSASGVKMYINGAERGQTVGVNNLSSSIANAIPFQLSGRNGANVPINASMDEVRAYNRVLSVDEVSRLYRLTSPTGVDTGLKGYWSFNGKDLSGTTAYDRSGSGNNGTLTNSPTKAPGKLGQALSFNGTTQYVTAGDPSNLDPTSSFSLSTWVKTTQSLSAGNYAAIAGKGFLATTNGYGLLLNGDDSSKPVFQARTGATIVWTSGPSVNDGNWHFLTGVRDHPNNTTHLYVDGQLGGTATGALTSYSSSDSFGIGARHASSTWGHYYSGTTDEVRFYNRALTAAEIQSLYALGQSDKVNSAVSQPQGTGRLDSGLAGYWKLDENTGTSAGDASTNANTGTLTNGPTWTTGQIGSAVDFDGTNDYVAMGTSDNLNTPSAVTVSVWIKSNYNFGSVLNVMFGAVSRMQDVSTFNGYEIGVGGNYISAGNKAYFHAGGTYTTNALIGTSTVNDGAWHHLVGKYDGTKSYIYVDGILENSGNKTNNLNRLGENFDVGNNYDRTRTFPGSIDEARIYNRALSADEVSQLYRLTAPTGVDTGLKGYWSFNGKDMSGTTAYDRSGAGNTGTLTNGPTKVPGKLGQGLSFDGTDDYVDLGSYVTTFDDYATGTVSAWFKLGNSGTNPSQTIIAIADKDVTTDRFEIAIGEGTATYADESASVVFAKAGAVVYAPFVRNGHTYYLDNAWHHIAVAVGANFNKIYIDGVEKSVTYLNGSATSTGFLNVNNVDVMTVGRRNLSGYGSNFSSGKLDEVRIYNRALSADEIKALYNASR